MLTTLAYAGHRAADTRPYIVHREGIERDVLAMSDLEYLGEAYEHRLQSSGKESSPVDSLSEPMALYRERISSLASLLNLGRIDKRNLNRFFFFPGADRPDPVITNPGGVVEYYNESTGGEIVPGPMWGKSGILEACDWANNYVEDVEGFPQNLTDIELRGDQLIGDDLVDLFEACQRTNARGFPTGYFQQSGLTSLTDSPICAVAISDEQTDPRYTAPDQSPTAYGSGIAFQPGLLYGNREVFSFDAQHKGVYNTWTARIDTDKSRPFYFRNRKVPRNSFLMVINEVVLTRRCGCRAKLKDSTHGDEGWRYYNRGVTIRRCYAVPSSPQLNTVTIRPRGYVLNSFITPQSSEILAIVNEANQYARPFDRGGLPIAEDEAYTDNVDNETVVRLEGTWGFWISSYTANYNA